LKLGHSLGSRKQAILLAVLAVVLVLAIVRWRPGQAPSPAPVRSASSRVAPDGSGPEDAPALAPRRSASKEVSPEEVPLLSVEDLGTGPARGAADTGRDLFDLSEPTRPPQPTPTPAPPVPGDIRFVGPLPPPPPTPTPAPPAITFKFIGTFGPRNHPIAVIQQGEQTLNVRAGDVLFGKFVLRKVGYESIDVGFVGFAESETRRLGITP
jgi:hypothetical protein